MFSLLPWQRPGTGGQSLIVEWTVGVDVGDPGGRGEERGAGGAAGARHQRLLGVQVHILCISGQGKPNTITQKLLIPDMEQWILSK